MTDVIAFDPGGTTGWARRTGTGLFVSGQGDWYSVLHTTHETLQMEATPIIVCEDFIFTNQTLKKTRQTYSTEGIGVLRYLAQRYGREFVLQTPAAAKTFSTDAKLKRIGWHVPGQNHANDAARHLLLYAASNGLVAVSDFI